MKYTKSELVDLLLELWKKFAWRSYEDERPMMISGGMPVLRELRDFLVAKGLIDSVSGIPPNFPIDETTGFALRRPQDRRNYFARSMMGNKRRKKKG
jgi:hypothetical protein